MTILTKIYKAKNNKGTIQILKELKGSRELERVTEELSPSLIKVKAKEISDFNLQEQDVFFGIIENGEIGFLTQKSLKHYGK